MRPAKGRTTREMTSLWKVIHHSLDALLHSSSTEIDQQTHTAIG